MRKKCTWCGEYFHVDPQDIALMASPNLCDDCFEQDNGVHVPNEQIDEFSDADPGL